MKTPDITAIVPVREGSRRLKNKNLVPFAGTNLLVYKLEQLKRVSSLQRILVSSDSDTMLEFACNTGVDIHKRTPEYCDEKTKSFGEVVRHICEYAKSEHILWATCTAPLVSAQIYELAIQQYFQALADGFDSLMSVEVFRRYLWDKNGPINYELGIKHVPSQQLAPLYFVTDGVMLAPRLMMIEWSYFHGPNPYRFMLDKRSSIDIDDGLDLACARAWLDLDESVSRIDPFRENVDGFGGGSLCLAPIPPAVDRTNEVFVPTHSSLCASGGVSSKRTAAKIVVFARDTSVPLYHSWMPHCSQPVETYNDYGLDWEPPSDTALLVTHDTYTEPGMTIIRRAVSRGVPTLILSDGILRYDNIWEHPQLAIGAQLQPVLGHKFACIGRSQARILESWHNIGKCEIVGATRFDRYLGLNRRQRKPTEPFRVLLMTANNPYYTEAQHLVVRESLRDLQTFIVNRPMIAGVQLEPAYRLTMGLEREIGLTSCAMNLIGLDLADVLQGVDAVISTPSTTMQEAMLLGIPVAALDYGNTPHYVPTAWRITAQRHILEVLVELVSPPEPKLLFQDTMLHDSLECITPATPRLLNLIAQMIVIGQAQYHSRPNLIFPRRMLPVLDIEFAPAEDRFCLDALFPKPKSAPELSFLPIPH